jgi:hypothetical protein
LKISLKDAFARISRLAVFKATGNFHVEIMRGEIVEKSNDTNPVKELKFLLTFFSAFLTAVRLVIFKAISDSDSQIMGVSSVKINEGAKYLSVYGYCMQHHKKTPEKEIVYKIVPDEKYIKTGKVIKKY